jgi:hypothetical protein
MSLSQTILFCLNYIMTYSPTPTEGKQDKALVDFLEALQKNACLAGEASVCSISGGARSRKTRTTSSRQAEELHESGSESDGSSSSPSQRHSKKATPIKKKAARECEREEEWMQYINIARVLVISGTVGAGALAMSGVFSSYADAMMETLGYGSISRVCGEGNYLLNYGASRVIPGMKSCADVTRMQQEVIAKAWGGIVAIGAAFRISMPQQFSATPGAMIDGLAKMLCRFFKERELHNELMQKIAAQQYNQADLDRAVAKAIAAQKQPNKSSRSLSNSEVQSSNSDSGGKVKSHSNKSKKSKKRSYPKHRRSTRTKPKSKGGKKSKGHKTRSKYHKKHGTRNHRKRY